MSLYTKGEKIKSLWHPITDEDFDIDFSKPFIVYAEDASLIIFDGLQDLYENYMDEERFFDFNAQKLSEEGKESFRDDFYGYMYLDEEFYKAIDWAKGEYIEDVKGERERPELFVMDEIGPKVIDHFGFDPNGDPAYEGTPKLCRDFAVKHPELYKVKYIVNLNWVPATSIYALFTAPVGEPKTAYVVTSGCYSDYHIDGVFSDKKKAEIFADKDGDRSIELYSFDDEQMLMRKDWYEVDISIGASSEVKEVSARNLGFTYFDAVKFTKEEKDCIYFSFFVSAISREKAKAIALERYHALLAVEKTHFPMLRWVRIVNPARNYKVFESLVFGYFDYKAYYRSCGTVERVQDLFMKIKDSLPKPLFLDEDSIDWQNLTEDTCMKLIRDYGFNIEKMPKLA